MAGGGGVQGVGRGGGQPVEGGEVLQQTDELS